MVAHFSVSISVSYEIEPARPCLCILLVSNMQNDTAQKTPVDSMATEAKAKEIFMNGIWCEQNGLVYEGKRYQSVFIASPTK